MHIRDLKQYVELSYQQGTGQARCDLLAAHREAVKAHIAQFETYLARIEDKIAWYQERLPRLQTDDDPNNEE